jgi:hypothetical protein
VLKKEANDYFLAANPQAEFVYNFPQEIYLDTSLLATIPLPPLSVSLSLSLSLSLSI